MSISVHAALRTCRACVLWGGLWIAFALWLPLAAQTPAASDVPPPVVINEILAHTDPPLVDTVELFNDSAAVADISHWCLSDKSEQPCLLTMQADTTIAPHGFLLISLGDDATAPFQLSEGGETLTLLAANATGAPLGYTDTVKFGPTPNGVSVGRLATSDGQIHYPLLRALTLGAANAAPLSSPIVLAEILYRPEPGKPQYIRVLNHSAAPQRFYHPDLANAPWEVDGIGALTLPPDIVLQPGESLYVSAATPQITRAAYALSAATRVYGPWGGTLQADGEKIELKRPDKPDEVGEAMPMIVVDTVDFLAEPPWPATTAGAAIHRLSMWHFGSDPANWTQGERHTVYLPAVTY